MMFLRRIVIFACSVFVLQTVCAALSQDQANVCQKSISYRENYTTSYIGTIRVKTLTWCAGLPPRCTKWVNKYETRYKTAQRLASRTVHECCPGYQQKGNDCLPHCPSGCVHGECMGPGHCDCLPGWRGTSCESGCAKGRWGENCAQMCQCVQENGECDVLTGRCDCYPGFNGTWCQNRCPVGTFGAHCLQQCKCAPGRAQCDPLTGRCNCLEGYYGPLCDKTCVEGAPVDGVCVDDCPCQNGATCDIRGNCVCTPGWTGPVCALTCPSGRYGNGCTRQCVCYNNGSCDHITGRCHCPPGYTGNKCEISCPLNKFGVNCEEDCECMNNAYCSHLDGTCTCTAQFMGRRCDLPVCPLGFYGASCSSRCKCILENSECDSWTGQCSCKPGFRGPRCGLRCDPGKFGLGCVQQCYCKENEDCSHIHGCVAKPETDTINDESQEDDDGVLIGFMCVAFLVMILLLAVCLVVYYRRRYKRLKHTTDLVVQYTRADMGDPAACSSSREPSSRGATGGARRSEKAKMLEAGVDDYEDDAEDDEESGAAARRPIYTGALSQCQNSPHAASRSRPKRRARESEDIELTPQQHRRHHRDDVPYEAPPPYTPTPQLPTDPAPPPYSVDTPAARGAQQQQRNQNQNNGNHGNHHNSDDTDVELGARGGVEDDNCTASVADSRDYEKMPLSEDELGLETELRLLQQNSVNESREGGLP